MINRIHSFSFKEIIITDEMNSTDDEHVDSFSMWTHEQLIICIISISLTVLLLVVLFIVPIVVIIHRIHRHKHQLDLRESSLISEYM